MVGLTAAEVYGFDLDALRPHFERVGFEAAGIQHVVAAPWRSDLDSWLRSMELLAAALGDDGRVVAAPLQHDLQLLTGRECGEQVVALEDEASVSPAILLAFFGCQVPDIQEPPVVLGEDLTAVDTKTLDYKQQSSVPLASETHGGEDVGIFAWGPMAHLFPGTAQQQYIYHVMACASGLGGDATKPCLSTATTAAQ